jgi:hypothetical protein
MASGERSAQNDIGKDEPITVHHFANSDREAMAEHRPGVREGVKLALLTASTTSNELPPVSRRCAPGVVPDRAAQRREQ